MRRLVLIVLLCIFILSSLTACYDAKEIDEWAYVYTIGIDKGVDNDLRFTFQIPSLKLESGGGGGGVQSGTDRSHFKSTGGLYGHA